MVPIIIIVLLLLVVVLLRPNRRMKKLGDQLPGPPSYPIVGNSFEFLKAKPKLQIVKDLSNKYGSVVRLWLGNQLFLLINDAKDIEMFLTSTKHLNKTVTYRMLDTWLGKYGLITSDADIWRKHRRLLTPVFHHKILESSVDVINENSDVLVQKLAVHIDEPEFDITNYIERWGLDVLCEAIMGIKLQTQSLKNASYQHSLKTLTDSLVERALSPWLHPDIIFRFSVTGSAYFRALEKVKAFIGQVIENRKEDIRKETESLAESGTDIGTRKRLLDTMLTNDNFCKEEIENEMQTFMFAGHDTTTTTVSFCLFCLSQHQEIQTKAFNEIETILSDGRDATYQDLSNMKYLENVIKETMRMYPAVPIISRKAEEDIALPSGYLIPAGSSANLHLIFVQNDSKNFQNPETFNPDRFENENSQHHPYSYVPFSAGLRNCIGKKFAMLKMKGILSILLRRYEFLPSKKVKSVTLETGVVLRSLEGLPLRIATRN